MDDGLSRIGDNTGITAQDRPRRNFHLEKHCLVLFQSQVHFIVVSGAKINNWENDGEVLIELLGWKGK